MDRLNQLLGMILTSSKTSATTTAAVSYFREEYKEQECLIHTCMHACIGPYKLGDQIGKSSGEWEWSS